MKLFSLCGLLSVVIISSCTVFKTISVDATEQAMKSVSPTRSVVTIHEYVANNEYVLENFSLENDSIKGIVITPPEGDRHFFNQETFNSKSAKAYDPLSTMHIFTTLGQISLGSFGMPIDSIVLIEIHEKHKGKSAGQTVGVIVGGTVFVLGVSTILYDDAVH